MKHLLFYCCPLQGNGMWQRNLEILSNYWGLFSGEKIITIALGRGMSPPDQVLKYLPNSAHILFVSNDSTLGEVPHFLPALQVLKNKGVTDGNVFYAHAKGVSIKNTSIRYKTVCAWTEALYKINLSRIDLIDWALKEYKCAGAFRRLGAFPEIPSSEWHYSGNFWWANIRDIWQRNWHMIKPENTRYGVEGYLSNLFTVDESWDFLPKIKWLHPYQRPPRYFQICVEVASITPIGKKPTFFRGKLLARYMKVQIESLILFTAFNLKSISRKLMGVANIKN